MGNRAIKHLFDWQPSGSAGALGYQRDGFESSFRYAGKIRGVREQKPFKDLSEKEREDRESAAAHIIQIWPDLQVKLTK